MRREQNYQRVFARNTFQIVPGEPGVKLANCIRVGSIAQEWIISAKSCDFQASKRMLIIVQKKKWSGGLTWR
jgi:hypothetical protein